MKHLVLLVVTILVPALLFLVYKWPQDVSKTLSQHAAAHKAAIIYYGLLFLIIIPLLAAFFYIYFIPTFKLSFVFTTAITVAMLTQLVIVFVPETGGMKSRIHRGFFTISAAAIFIAVTTLIFAPLVPAIAHIVALIATIVSFILAIVVVYHGAKHPYYLLIQIIFYALFLGTVLTVTYTS